MTTKPLDDVDSEELARVAGGSAHTVPTVRKDDSQLIAMMMNIANAVASFAKNASKSDPMTTMLPMILGMQGGGPPPPGKDGGAPPSGGAQPGGGKPAKPA